MNKQHILDEIRRTAKENGGVPLGKGRFESQTGIKESDWSGKYWARWGRAVEEAGFQANAMNSRLEDDVVLAPLAAFVRELGRLPVTTEVRLRKRQDAGFPNEKTVFSRFGYGAQLATRLLAFCEQAGGWSDVAAICQNIVNPRLETSESTERDSEEDDCETGYVYLALMKIGKEKRYKIGKADMVGTRTRQIAVNLPEDLELIHAIATDDAYGIEAYWHKRFNEKRRGGEWFVLTAADVKAFKRRKFM
jgi:hypothetical protein